MQKRAIDLEPGELVDLHGDKFADPDCDPGKGYEFAYATVDHVERETASCVCVYFTDADACGFPVDHMLTFVGKDIA